jgi:RNA polymerase sigma-B factor
MAGEASPRRPAGGDAREARERAIEEQLPLVRSVARRFARSGGEPLDDLVQVGTIGLIKAVDRFDPSRDRDLAALARPSIEGEIRHHLRDRATAVRVPRSQQELAARLRVLDDELTAARGRAPALAELAAAAGVDEAEAAAAVRAAEDARPLALDAEGARTPPARDETEAAEARALLAAGWAVLDDRERRMLHLRFHEDRSQGQIARELGLSQAHVSRLLRAALERLRAEVGADAGEPHAAAAMRPSGRLDVPMPPSLQAEVARAAEREGVPLSAFVAGVLADEVGWDEAPAARDRRAPAEHAAARRRWLLLANLVVVGLAVAVGLALLLAAWLG